MLSETFVLYALLAGSLIALASGLVGYFVVVRSQVFAGDALSHVAFTGTLAAAAAGLDLRVGLFAATVLVALLIAGLGERADGDDAPVGIVMAWVLGLGVLFLDLWSSSASGSNGTVASRALFGSIFGLSAGEAQLAALIAAAIVVALLSIGRPLLFASIDPALARAQGVPVRSLGFAFLVLLGIEAAEATEAVGALLLLGLLAAPAGAAQRLSANPYRAMGLSGLIAVASTWIGITLSYQLSLPPGSAIILVAATFYASTIAI